MKKWTLLIAAHTPSKIIGILDDHFDESRNDQEVAECKRNKLPTYLYWLQLCGSKCSGYNRINIWRFVWHEQVQVTFIDKPPENIDMQFKLTINTAINTDMQFKLDINKNVKPEYFAK